MFEDASFESMGTIRTRSRSWMVATFLLNGTILVGLILIPLIDPESLPHEATPFLLTTPAPPTSTPPLSKAPQQASHGTSEMESSVLPTAARIPRRFLTNSLPEEAPGGTLSGMEQGASLPDGGTGVFAGQRAAAVVQADAPGPVRLPSTVAASVLIWRSTPVYPPIAKAAGVEGTVVLEATISKTGTIENLRAVSGPAMLTQAAIDAVKQWRYRPYLLDRMPVEVETTINVVFRLAR
jgi:periplasmic protein TonB